MIENTRGIVLRQTRYSESSLILKIYTEEFGLQTYMASGVRSAKSRGRGVMLQAPNILSLVVHNKEGRSMQRIREMQPHIIYTKIPFEIARSSTALFITEVLLKCLKDENKDLVMFEFLINALKVLDTSPGGLAAFPTVFLLELSRFLGFRPQGESTNELPLFDLQEGVFVAERPGHGIFLYPEECEAMQAALCRTLTNTKPFALSIQKRQMLLDKLLIYYRLHVDGFGILKSPEILKAVLGRG
jgi:DNA repair protein RecO (recombination protein O)